MVINTNTARSDIFNEFYDVIDANITTGIKVTNAFVNDIAKFPQVVVHGAILPRNREAFGTESKSYDRSGSIDVEVYARKTKEAVQLADEVDSIVFNNLSALTTQNIGVGTSSEVQIEIGGKTVKGYVLPFTFKYSR